MTRSRFSLLLFLLLAQALLLPACESDSTDNEAGQEPIGLLSDLTVIDSTLLLVDEESDRVFLLDLAEDELAEGKSVVELPPNPFLVERRQGRAKEALILTAGRRGVSQGTALSVLRANGKIRTYQVSVPFDSLAQTEDGRYAVLYFGQGSEQLLSSLNEIAVVDLEAETESDSAVVRRSVNTPGGPPVRLEVSPPLSLGERSKRFALLFSASYVTLLELDDLESGETVIRLSSGEGDAALLPEQVVYQPARSAIYLRETNSDDVFAIRFNADGNGFETSVEQLAVGAAPSDMTVYGEDEAARLLVVSESDRQVHIVDVSKRAGANLSNMVHIDLEDEADSVLLFETDAPEDADVDKQQHALLYQEGGRVLTFLDLLDAETQGERNLQSVRVGEPVASLEPLLDQNLALILHQSSRIRVLDLEERKIITNVDVEGSLYNAVFTAELPRLWVAPSGQYFAGCVNLRSGHTEEVLLDRPLAGFVLAPVPELAVALHEVAGDEEEGTLDRIAVTVLDALDPEPEEAVTFEGFLD
jgi:hypothetical protein